VQVVVVQVDNLAHIQVHLTQEVQVVVALL
jgi:hypothetical protein